MSKLTDEVPEQIRTYAGNLEYNADLGGNWRDECILWLLEQVNVLLADKRRCDDLNHAAAVALRESAASLRGGR